MWSSSMGQNVLHYIQIRPSLSSAMQPLNQLVQDLVVGDRTNHFIFPAIAVSEQGQGVIVFSVLGPNLFPSAAVLLFTAEAGPSLSSPVYVYARGSSPYYSFEGDNNGCRWGDYIVASVVSEREFWVVAPYVPNRGANCFNAHWGSAIARIRVPAGSTASPSPSSRLRTPIRRPPSLTPSRTRPPSLRSQIPSLRTRSPSLKRPLSRAATTKRVVATSTPTRPIRTRSRTLQRVRTSTPSRTRTRTRSRQIQTVRRRL